MLIDVNGKEYGSRANAGDAGIDLVYRAEEPWAENLQLEPGERWLFSTGAWVNPGELDGGVGLICPRSGLAYKSGITVMNAPGIIDARYEGEIKVNLVNLSNDSVIIREGDRIAQFVPVPVMGWSNEGTERGEGGHGSSGR